MPLSPLESLPNAALRRIIRGLNAGNVARLQATSREFRRLGPLVGPANVHPVINPPSRELADKVRKRLIFAMRVFEWIRSLHMRRWGYNLLGRGWGSRRGSFYKKFTRFVTDLMTKHGIPRQDISFEYVNPDYEDVDNLAQVDNSNSNNNNNPASRQINLKIRCNQQLSFVLELAFHVEDYGIIDVKLYFAGPVSDVYLYGNPFRGTEERRLDYHNGHIIPYHDVFSNVILSLSPHGPLTKETLASTILPLVVLNAVAERIMWMFVSNARSRWPGIPRVRVFSHASVDRWITPVRSLLKRHGFKNISNIGVLNMT
jgi:hypothetical protein